MITQENIPYTADEVKAMVKTCEKYNKALERMKSWANGEHPECFSEAQKTAEFIFPELKENEDERIRKGLIKTISSLLDNTILYHTNITKEEALAWLEKQGENKYTEDKTIFAKCFPELKESKDERIRKTIYGWIYAEPSEFFDNGFSKEEMIAWVEKQKGD